MTTVASTSSASTTTASTTATAAATSTENEFLSILTTELTNQDPLNAMDPSTFTSQLVSYSQLEQQLTTNTTLTGLGTQLTGITSLLTSLAASATSTSTATTATS